MFDSTAAGGRSETTPSDAILCRKGSPIATSRKTYTSAHRSAESAASTAQDAADSAADVADDPATTTALDALNARHTAAGTTATQSETDSAEATDANTDVSKVRSALSRARSALTTVENALRAAARAALTDAAKSTLTGGADAAEMAADELTTALDAEDLTTASTTATSAKTTAVTAAKGVLGGANGDDALDAAASVLLTWAQQEHTGFKLRATVSPGDEEYVVVVALQNTATSPDPQIATATALDLNVSFHGAIEADPATSDLVGRLQSDTPPDQYSIVTNAAGLLTLETTGSVDTVGVLQQGTNNITQADSGGAGDNFKIDVPLPAQTYTLSVRGNVPEVDVGSYTLGMDFKVAMTHTPAAIIDGGSVTVLAGADWNTSPDVSVPDDGLAATHTPAIKTDSHTNNNPDEDYFAFSIANTADTQGFLTVEATEDGTAATDANPKGTLYGPRGEVTADATSTGFLMRVPVSVPQDSAMNHYLVKVERGREGAYLLKFTFRNAVLFGQGDFPGIRGKTQAEASCAAITPNDYEICPIQGNDPAQQEVERFVFDMQETGTLYLHTTGDTDTVGTLYGPDGTLLATDNNSGDGNNFMIAERVGVGLHLLEVRGSGRQEEGVYQLVTNFIRGSGPVDVTDPEPPDTTDPPDTGTPVTTLDPIGSLDEPAPGSFRSGVGVLRGWVCNAGGTGVEIRLTNTSTNQVTRIMAPNGAARGDVNTSRLCTGRVSASTIGFAVQFNYNLLPAGEYTAEAFIGLGRSEEQIGLTEDGQTNTFEVVRISDDEFLTDTELEDLGLGPDEVIECEVPNFPPDTRQRVILGWDEASQNFQIVDVE